MIMSETAYSTPDSTRIPITNAYLVVSPLLRLTVETMRTIIRAVARIVAAKKTIECGYPFFRYVYNPIIETFTIRTIGWQSYVDD